jgi:hypothetical protein
MNIGNNMQQFDNKHLDIRSQFITRISGELLRNPDAAYKFISIVCNEVSISELPILEMMFKNSITKELPINNNN